MNTTAAATRRATLALPSLLTAAFGRPPGAAADRLPALAEPGVEVAAWGM
jgi:hypothetical protein